jgi:hypothetical protein
MGIEWSSQLALVVLKKRVWSRARGEQESVHFVVVGQWIETWLGGSAVRRECEGSSLLRSGAKFGSSSARV